MMKKSVAVMTVMGLVLATSFAFAGSGLAQGPWGRGCGGSYGQMESAPQAAPEQLAKAQKLRDAYFQSTITLRGQLHETKAALSALMAALTPDKAKIEATSQELGILRGKLNAERAELMAQLRKEGVPPRRYFNPQQVNRHGGKRGFGRHRGGMDHDGHAVSLAPRDDL